METLKMGFAPVYNANSRVLILGSFPSVKSREVSFYYGNKQNRFWKTVCGYFSEDIPQTVEGKTAFLLRRGIALWDMVASCEIKGSSDASVKNAEIADLNEIFEVAKNLKGILLNGNLAYELFLERYLGIEIPYRKMPSTSPANPRFSMEIWRDAFNEIF